MIAIGSLFSGIGGLELGLEAAFMESGILARVAWQVEQEPFCGAVLAKHWPDADRSVTDVRQAGAGTLARVDVICGGFPCQDLSYAGRGAGLAGERSGLWWEFLRVIRELEPRLVVVENVAALLSRGIGDVLGPLAALGYDARWDCIRASDVGAPHRRERLFIVAYSDSSGRQGKRPAAAAGGTISLRGSTAVANTNGDGKPQPQGVEQGIRGRAGNRGFELANADSFRRKAPGRARQRPDVLDAGDQAGRASSGPELVAQSGLGGDTHGLPGGLDAHRWPSGPGEQQHEGEPERTIAKSPNRAARLKALGNAVVPQVALQVGRWILSSGLLCVEA